MHGQNHIKEKWLNFGIRVKHFDILA